MTVTFGTNSQNDIFIGGDGNLAIYSGIDAVLYACATASKAQLGEMVLAIKQGIPNFQTIWVGTPNYPLWTSYLRKTLQGVLGVKEVKSIELFRVENTLKYTATIVTQFGTGVING